MIPLRSGSGQVTARRSRRQVLFRSLVTLCCLTFSGQQAVAWADSNLELRMVVHPDNPTGSVSREFVTDVYLKRRTQWPGGETAHPVDQRADSGTRQLFSDKVLRRSVAAVKRYWQQRIFSGRELPPPELDSDAAVVDYVLQHRGAIGYVSGNAKLERVKAVPIR